MRLSPKVASGLGVGMVVLAVAVTVTLLVMVQAFIWQLILGGFGWDVRLAWLTFWTALGWFVATAWWYLAAYRA